jgi:hypothetical protein
LALIAGSNFFMTSPSKSLAPSGGFSFSITGFFLESFPPFFFLSSSSTFGGYSVFETSLLVSIGIEEVSLESTLGTDEDAGL